MRTFIGFTPHGTISKKKRIYWEAQLFAVIRSFKDGIRFFCFNINLDRYMDDHSPSFQIELTILNLYFHFWIYQNNYVIAEDTYEDLCYKLSLYGITAEEFNELATKLMDEGMEITKCYHAACEQLINNIINGSKKTNT
jgi:hypothetical protein